ncbi:DUF262 domain-containing protein [Brevundimonas diminuta]|uniref:DUF262 domain-containing protein n=1 Tax=Brevundimonas diminuta TaxID=293 RepID=UPI003207CB0B
MTSPLNASASSAGALISNSRFTVPSFQREYAWGKEEVGEFWRDLSGSLDADSYFLGLVILTEENGTRYVVDGQQRLITLSLLATALYHEALIRDRRALADRIQSDFLRSIDYETDSTDPRILLTDPSDNKTFQTLLDTGDVSSISAIPGSVSEKMLESYAFVKSSLQSDLSTDPFKRLGKWTEFITNRLYFAVFIHPDPATAYQVFEVINTRGKDLTTADLLKNYILSQTAPQKRDDRYDQWKEVSRPFPPEGTNNFVQYIRHVVTVEGGHILPKDLFGFLAQRDKSRGRTPPAPDRLMALLEDRLPLYLQMIDQTAAGPADQDALGVFSALNSLGVIAVRPILLAMSDVPHSVDGMRFILQLVVRRMVVGNLGTGNVERRFGEAAKKVADSGNWSSIIDDFSDLNPSKDEFVNQLKKRSFNKAVLAFLRRSIIQDSITPDHSGTLHFIWERQAGDWKTMSEEDGSFWQSTIGNTFLADLERRPREVTDWNSFKALIMPHSVQGEWKARLSQVGSWDTDAVANIGVELAEAGGNLWYR